MAGKGDGRRPRFVSYEEYARRHEKAFGKKPEQEAPHDARKSEDSQQDA